MPVLSLADMTWEEVRDLDATSVVAVLPPNPSSLSTAIRDGASSFEEAGRPRACFGWPAEATAEEGREPVRKHGWRGGCAAGRSGPCYL